MTKSINRPRRAVSSPRAILLKLWSPYSSSVTLVSPLWCLVAVADSPERRWKVWLIPSEEIPLRFVVPAQLRLEERNSAETRNSALAQARRSPVERLACSGLGGGHEGQNVGLKGHSLVCWCVLQVLFSILKYLELRMVISFSLSLKTHSMGGKTHV